MNYIYELRYYDQGKWHPFYCGHTSDLIKRLSGHKSSANTGATTLVYEFIRDLKAVELKWDIFSVLEYTEYTGQEDEHILKLLFDGVKLENMKKGDIKWQERTLENMQKAKEAGCATVKEYKEWDRVETQRLNDLRHEQRVREGKELSWHDKLVKRITEAGPSDAQKLKIMQDEAAQIKAQEILKGVRR